MHNKRHITFYIKAVKMYLDSIKYWTRVRVTSIRPQSSDFLQDQSSPVPGIGHTSQFCTDYK